MKKFFLLRGVIFLFFLVASSSGSADEKAITASENKLLAAFSINLAKFTSWPTRADLKDPEAPIQFGVVSNSELLSELEASSIGKKIGTHPIQIRNLLLEESISKNWPAVVLLMSKSDTLNVQALKKFKNCRCLIITHKSGWADLGSVINFYLENEKLRFEINPKTAKDQELELSSQILRLGKIIE